MMPGINLPKAEVKFQTWFADFVEDMTKTGTRLKECGVKQETINKIIKDSIIEVIPEATEIKIKGADE